ncbi:MAG: DUF177 domain-containing protein [Clostridium sp.]|nr:DUF177 domain-containing protein [Clostridium sp.]
MRLNLYDILSVAGKEKIEKAAFTKQEVSYFGETLKVSAEDEFDVALTHKEKGIVDVALSGKITVIRACSRCLEDVSKEYLLDITRVVNVETCEVYTDNQEENEKISYIEDCTLDVDMLILDELYTILPMNVLCKEDCKGICKVCGTNLNKSTCDCDQTVPDPRMAVFSDIFNQFKEV